MFCPAKGEEPKGDMSAEARRWCPFPAFRDDGGRREEWDASGVLFLLPITLLAAMRSDILDERTRY